MQAVHEAGHVVGAWATGGDVERVVLHPLSISRTDVRPNPHPLLVVWAGPLSGVLLPLAFWGVAAMIRLRGAFVLRFFAGFCCVANGAYIGFGSFAKVGDCGEMLRHGSPLWLLWIFGVITIPIGFLLWHRQGMHFGLGHAGVVDRPVAYSVAIVSVILVLCGLFLSTN
jgi:hypothetical protein